jgi:hypothetical protein
LEGNKEGGELKREMDINEKDVSCIELSNVRAKKRGRVKAKEKAEKLRAENEKNEGEKRSCILGVSRDEVMRNSDNESLDSCGITKNLVAVELYNVYLRCMQEVPVMMKDKESGKQVPTGVYQFDARCALKALQLLGDAVGLFKEKVAVENQSCSYEEFLKSGEYEYEF